MCVACQVLQCLLRATERRFREDHPFDLPHPATQRVESGWLAQAGHLAMKAEPAFLERLLQVRQKQVSEPATQNLHGQEEGWFWVLGSNGTENSLKEGVMNGRSANAVTKLPLTHPVGTFEYRIQRG